MENKIKELIEAGYSIEDIAEAYKQEEKRMKAAAAAKEREAKVKAAEEVLARAMSDYLNLALDTDVSVEECAAMIRDITRQVKVYFCAIPEKATKAKNRISVDNVRTMDELEEWLKSMGL
jgi:DNA-binding transcriptional MerR regulator